MEGWQVYILDVDKLRRYVRVYVGRSIGERDQYVTPLGQIQEVSPDVQPNEELGWHLPVAVLQPLHAALTEHLGKSLPSAGEMSTLREWLAVERGRVDKFLSHE